MSGSGITGLVRLDEVRCVSRGEEAAAGREASVLQSKQKRKSGSATKLKHMCENGSFLKRCCSELQSPYPH